jgi:hypothetical protein
MAAQKKSNYAIHIILLEKIQTAGNFLFGSFQFPGSLFNSIPAGRRAPLYRFDFLQHFDYYMLRRLAVYNRMLVYG